MRSSLVGVQRRISQGLKVLQYYTTKNWSFKNEKFLHMMELMSPADRKRFYFSVEEVRYRLIYCFAFYMANTFHFFGCLLLYSASFCSFISAFSPSLFCLFYFYFILPLIFTLICLYFSLSSASPLSEMLI